MKDVTIDDFEEGLKDALNKYLKDYRENNKRDPENWPLSFKEGAFFEDFLCWVELNEVKVP